MKNRKRDNQEIQRKKRELNKKLESQSNLHQEYIAKSFKQRVRMKLIEEYVNGNFYNIPRELFNDEEGKLQLDILKNCYKKSINEKESVPKGLYSVGNKEEVDELFNILIEKAAKGAKITFLDYRVYSFSEKQKRQLEEKRNRYRKLCKKV